MRTQGGREARDLVERLIRGQAVPDDRRHPAAPGLDPTGRLLTIVGRVEAAEGAVGDALQAARDTLEESMALGKARPLVAIRQGEVVLIGGSADRLPMPGGARSRSTAPTSATASASPGSASPASSAYPEALLSLSYTSAARPIVSLAELSALECALLGADATTREVIAAKGERLDGEDRAAVFELVRAFAAADLNVARAAGALGVHPNTVRYRLERVAAGSGHDPRTFAGLLELLCVAEIG